MIYLLGEIDKDTTVQFLKEIDWVIEKYKHINIGISSSGGDIWAGYAIQAKITQLRIQGFKIDGYVLGQAYSAAFDVLQKCDRRYAYPFSSLMQHEEQFEGGTSTSEAQLESSFSRKNEKIQFELLSKRTTVSSKYYMSKIKNGNCWYLTAEEALQHGLIDEILQIPDFQITPSKMINKRNKKVVE